MKLIDEIMNHPELRQKPPVLVDVGASGEVHKKWKKIAPYSICVAYDADTRDFRADEIESDFKKLFRINRIVSAQSSDSSVFWLTQSPHCSSTLEPDVTALQDWAFAPLFHVLKQVKLPAVTLAESLASCGLDYIDWFKTDSQGTDLRLFASLSDAIRRNVLVAEFEPGILNAYLHEDKLSNLMGYMEGQPLWVQNMIVRGSQRISQQSLRALTPLDRWLISVLLRKSPGWCDITYINNFQLLRDRRHFMLGWVFSTIQQEYGYALDLAEKGWAYFGDSIFRKLKIESLRQLRRRYLSLPGELLKRAINKVL